MAQFLFFENKIVFLQKIINIKTIESIMVHFLSFHVFKYPTYQWKG